MNRPAAPFVPPPAPLPAPPVPTPPPAPAPLTSAEKARHLAGAFGGFVGGGLLGYGILRAFLAGWVDPCAATLGWGLAGACWVGAALLLLPFYTEWHAAQLWRAYHTDSLYHTRRHYARALHDQAQWAATYLRDRTPAADPPARLRVMGVERPAPETGEDVPPVTSSDVVNQARDLVERFLHRAPAVTPTPDPVPTERPTTRLPVLAWFRAPTPPPRVAYTADMRLVVRTMYETGGVADLLKSKTLPRGRWDAACKPLGAAGVFAKDKAGAWRLVPRFRYYGQDYGLTALHARVSAALQESM